MRSELDARSSVQIPLQLELWVPDTYGEQSETQKNETKTVVIDLVQDDEASHNSGVVIIEL